MALSMINIVSSAPSEAAANGQQPAAFSSMASSASTFLQASGPVVAHDPSKTAGLKLPLHAARAASVRCSSSTRSDQSEVREAAVMARIVAAGAALAVFCSGGAGAWAGSGPGISGPERTAQKADELLKSADKLNVLDAPQRFGPGRPGAAQDPTKISQKAGSGAASQARDVVGKAQEGAGEVASKARESAKDILDRAKRAAGLGENMTSNAQQGVKGALYQAQGKKQQAEGVLLNAVGRAQRNAPNLGGDVAGEAQEGANKAADSARDILGRVRGGLSGGEVASNVQQGAKGALTEAQGKKGQAEGSVKEAIGQAQRNVPDGSGIVDSIQQGFQGLKESVAEKGSDAKKVIDDAASTISQKSSLTQ